MQITIDFNAPHLKRAYDSIKLGAHDRRKVLDVMAETVMAQNRKRHEREVAPDGTPWAPVAMGTIASIVSKIQDKRNYRATSERGPQTDMAVGYKVRGSKRPLYDTGQMLRESLIRQPGDGPDSVRVGFDVVRAAWHHFGTGIHGPKGQSYVIRPKNKRALFFGGLTRKSVTHPGIPARPLLGVPSGDIHELEQDVVDVIMEEMRKARAK